MSKIQANKTIVALIERHNLAAKSCIIMRYRFYAVLPTLPFPILPFGRHTKKGWQTCLIEIGNQKLPNEFPNPDSLIDSVKSQSFLDLDIIASFWK